MRKLRPRQIMCLVQGHMAGEGQRLDGKAGPLRLQSKEEAKRCLQVMCAWLNIQGTQQTAVHRFRKK